MQVRIVARRFEKPDLRLFDTDIEALPRIGEGLMLTIAGRMEAEVFRVVDVVWKPVNSYTYQPVVYVKAPEGVDDIPDPG
jgi:hypothetical protein